MRCRRARGGVSRGASVLRWSARPRRARFRRARVSGAFPARARFRRVFGVRVSRAGDAVNDKYEKKTVPVMYKLTLDQPKCMER